jgi:DNA-directed RNA polymerase specialized sigma24 family protein
MDKAMKLVEAELEKAEREGGYKLIERISAWKLRIQGYSIVDIAEELDIGIGTAHKDVKWCIANLPAAYETAEDFKHVSLEQLEKQYKRVMAGRDGEPPTEIAERVGVAIKELQARLLGALSPTRVDSSMKLEYNITGVKTEEI